MKTGLEALAFVLKIGFGAASVRGQGGVVRDDVFLVAADEFAGAEAEVLVEGVLASGEVAEGFAEATNESEGLLDSGVAIHSRSLFWR